MLQESDHASIHTDDFLETGDDLLELKMADELFAEDDFAFAAQPDEDMPDVNGDAVGGSGLLSARRWMRLVPRAFCLGPHSISELSTSSFVLHPLVLGLCLAVFFRQPPLLSAPHLNPASPPGACLCLPSVHEANTCREFG